ncbi:MAG: UDP-3-O-acyl-N-acetylglucosamine deacetylase [Paracoccaceae bacterium]|nr:UDP-3-O-acyl-N-acetylglucosamine deacetylase [Paracoccaceae bacterium]
MQSTLGSSVKFSGFGLHSGAPVTLVIHPADIGHGLQIKRTDAGLRVDAFSAHWTCVSKSPLCTRLVNTDGMSVSTIEHVMAALAGCGVHNALLELDGPEAPILDGSAVPFVEKILAAGVTAQNVPVTVFKVKKTAEFRTEKGWARLAPADTLQMEFHIDFEDAAIGVQSKSLNLSNGAFVRELCDSRTFCSQADVDYMHANGLALGGSLANAVVVDGESVLTPGGLRHRDEAVRHKMLDALGDLALAGAPVIGHYTGFHAGHAITNGLLRELFTMPGAVEKIECTPDMLASLPGVGVTELEIPKSV